ncbi:MAG TPA: hypothetical protein VG899_07860 [Mycobacteriales bacterium]|nr:hypothetical protein [Mycobacteriales bacterium]HWA66269.1 hypothetical protein [Mycobacteriales bacterium]
MRISGPSLTATALAVTAAAAISGCSGLEFVQDHRLSFTAPAEDQLTRLPVTLSWTMKPPGDYRFGIFIDQQAVKVGHNIDSVLPKGTRATPALLAATNVYETDQDHITIRIIPDLDYDRASRQRHQATVVLLAPNGDRLNESAWVREFDLPKSAP